MFKKTYNFFLALTIYFTRQSCSLITRCAFPFTRSLVSQLEVFKLTFSFRHWIAFCRCSLAIWIASERKAKQIKCTAFLSDAIHMAREHRQNAIQYLYLHLLTTKFVAILLTLTQKCHISQISNEQKIRHLEQPSRRKTTWLKPPCDPVQITRTKDRHF